MIDKKLEFLLKKIMYYSAHAICDFKRYSAMVDEEFEKLNEMPPDEKEKKEESKPDIDVAPLTPDEKMKLAEHKLLKRLEKYGFEHITLSKCKVNNIVDSDAEGERFFAYLVKQKFGRIERGLSHNKLMSVKFIFNKETYEKFYGKG